MITQNLWVFIFIVFIKLICAAITIVPDDEDKTNTSTVKNLSIKSETRYAFFRSIDAGATPDRKGSRRVFGGAAVELREFPAVCALLDRYWAVRCTGTILTKHWVLTAAHCVTPRIAYVKYNTRRPASTDGNVTAVYFLYRHPKYEVVQKDEGRGLDVTVLHHDVGLVRTRHPMKLTSAQTSVLNDLGTINPLELYNEEIQVLGFGRTERSVLGEELFSVRLRLVNCERGQWLHCVCGSAAEPRGVCSGDSGGPVVYDGLPVGVTSMGPVQCADAAVPAGASSVFTALRPYVGVINATILDTETALRMRMIERGAAPPAAAALLSLLCAAVICH